jgi:hypothetical protein
VHCNIKQGTGAHDTWAHRRGRNLHRCDTAGGLERVIWVAELVGTVAALSVACPISEVRCHGGRGHSGGEAIPDGARTREAAKQKRSTGCPVACTTGEADRPMGMRGEQCQKR